MSVTDAALVYQRGHTRNIAWSSPVRGASHNNAQHVSCCCVWSVRRGDKSKADPAPAARWGAATHIPSWSFGSSMTHTRTRKPVRKRGWPFVCQGSTSSPPLCPPKEVFVMLDRYGDEPLNDTTDREWAARQARAMAVVNCDFCDDDGYRGSSPCNHVDYRSIAARGMAKVREALEEKP